MGLTPRENFRQFYNHQIPEWLPDYRKDRQNVACTFLEKMERPRDPDNPDLPLRKGKGKDGFGVWYRVEESSFAAPSPDTQAEMVIKDITHWRDYVTMPDLEKVDWETMAAKDLANVDTSKFLNMSIGHGLYERLHFFMGMNEANIALMEEPEAIEDFFTTYFDYKIALVDKLAQYYSCVDMLEVSDDWGHKNGLFVSPNTWDELFAPQVSRLIRHVKSKGFLYLQHSCGKNERLIPHMIDAGIDCWTSSQAINDLHGIVAIYGDRFICSGGMDLPEFYDENYPIEKMREIVRERIFDLCPGGGFLPYGTFGVKNLAQVVSEVVQENRDFFRDPAHCILPRK